MTSKSFLDCERKRHEKLKKYQLPNTYKKMGLIVFIIAFIMLFLTTKGSDLKLIAKYGLIIGLLIMSISKEKIEDELIQNLRMQSYTFAFIAAVILTVTSPIFNYLVNFLFEKQQQIFESMGDWMILWLLLSIQVFYFHYLKKSYK